MLSVEVNLHWEELSIWVPHISPSMFAEQVGLDISAGVSSKFTCHLNSVKILN